VLNVIFTLAIVLALLTVLPEYAAAGGAYREVVLAGVGHSPHVERPQEFAVALLEHLDTPAQAPSGLT